MAAILAGCEVRFLATSTAPGACAVVFSQRGLLIEIRGAEASVRWKDPVNGYREPVLVPVENLVPVSDEFGSESVVKNLLAWSDKLFAQRHFEAARAVYGRALSLELTTEEAPGLEVFALDAANHARGPFPA